MNEVSPEEIAAELKRALAGEVIRCVPLLKGHGHQSFILETSSGVTLLFKIALRAEQLDKMRSLSTVLELAARHGVPAPRLLYFSEGTGSFSGRPWLIQEFLPGDDGEDALPRMPESERAMFFRDFGRAVARLHAIDLGYFSEDFAFAKREPAWATAVESRLARLTERHRHAKLLPHESVEAAQETILSAVRGVSVEVRTALVHRDLYLPNTLVTAGRFRCLLDFEHARSSDALSDFAKLEMWVFEEVPGSRPNFIEGYGADSLLTPDGRLRYHLWLGLELLSGMLHWHETGQSRMLADYQTRLRCWLTGMPLRDRR